MRDFSFLVLTLMLSTNKHHIERQIVYIPTDQVIHIAYAIGNMA